MGDGSKAFRKLCWRTFDLWISGVMALYFIFTFLGFRHAFHTEESLESWFRDPAHNYYLGLFETGSMIFKIWNVLFGAVVVVLIVILRRIKRNRRKHSVGKADMEVDKAYGIAYMGGIPYLDEPTGEVKQMVENMLACDARIAFWTGGIPVEDCPPWIQRRVEKARRDLLERSPNLGNF